MAAETLAEAWEEGRRAGGSRARRQMSDEPRVPEAVNPYLPADEQRGLVEQNQRYDAETGGRA